jgi:hypothetical protein
VKVPQRYIVQNSGGASSWGAARRLVDQYGPDAVLLLTANTNSEAKDWLPFIQACHADLGCELVMLDNDGRTIWDVFSEHRFLGNTRVDLCSRVLKREPLRAWLEANCDPGWHRVVIGFDFDEAHRIERARTLWTPWTVEFPLSEPPYRFKDELFADLEARGIAVPELYRQGFSHNNCGGACVKAGQAQWAHLLRVRPDTYLRAEAEEEKLRRQLGDVAILRDRRGGTTKPLTLAAFRARLLASEAYDVNDWGACSCMESAR